jgi:hypothetical protein
MCHTSSLATSVEGRLRQRSADKGLEPNWLAPFVNDQGPPNVLESPRHHVTGCAPWLLARLPPDQARSNRSRFMTLVQAPTKSPTSFLLESSCA